MKKCENCNCETKKLTEANASDYRKRFKNEKEDIVLVCTKCFNQCEERKSYLEDIIKSPDKKQVILAGPGTGKTYTFKEYINEKFKSDSVYISTFINNLVNNLKEEINEDNVKINTFHKFCYHLLRLLSKNYLYCSNLTDLIVEDSILLRGCQINKKKLYDDLKNFKVSSDIKFYFERGYYYNAVGNDNICWGLLKILKDRGGIDLSNNYKQIIIDEYQDFNFVESEIIKLISKNNKILIAGDDDQVLYTFKGSNPKYIRELFNTLGFTKFELPYCSRCTEVIIDSFNHFVKEVFKLNLLKDREPKKYICYFPDKYNDCKKYSQIYLYKAHHTKILNILIHNIKKYVDDGEIEKGKLNFLILFPKNRKLSPKNMENIINNLQDLGIKINDKSPEKKEDSSLTIESGYRHLKKDNKSNLGWRIVIKNDLFDGWEKLMQNTYDQQKNIIDLIPSEYKAKHLKIIESFTYEDVPPKAIEEEGINLMFTGFHGSKGLSADHVFILRPQNDIFPEDPNNIEENEIYQFLVALTRPKKSLSLITTYPHHSAFINMLPQKNIEIK